MKRLLHVVTAALVVCVLLMCASGAFAAFEDYGDVSGHWAEDSLRMAYDDGLMAGYGGLMRPDKPITLAEMMTLMCRVLGAEKTADISGIGLPAGAWYYNDAAKAVYLGLIDTDAAGFDSPIARQDAFAMLAEALQLTGAKPDTSVLDKFSDSRLVTDGNRKAVASLVSRGLVGGYDGALNANNSMTRAEFATLLYRAVSIYIDAKDADGGLSGGAILHGDADISGAQFAGDLWFGCVSSSVRLSDVTAEHAAIRSHTLKSLVIGGGSRIGRLTLAAQSGDVDVSPEEGSKIGTLAVGSGAGRVSVRDVAVIEVTGAGRTVTISGDAELVVVTAPNCTVSVASGVTVDKLELTRDARGSSVTVHGMVTELDAGCAGAVIDGPGFVSTLTLTHRDTKVGVRYGELVEDLDHGIEGASVRVSAPGTLPAGETLRAEAVIDNPVSGKRCSVIWYIDGKQISESVMTMGESKAEMTYNYEYSKDMAKQSVIRVVVRHETDIGEKQEISGEITINVTNYSDDYWSNLEIQRVLGLVTLGYKGDYTTAWAEKNDLTASDKEIWVNAKGYTSGTPYLIWVNLAYQRANVFLGSEGNWKLIRSCLVGTGASSSATPVGVWKTTYKQTGWYTSSYTVKPIVRFKGGGYAFHSRLYYPGSSTLKDASIGYPVSHGCVRMLDEDIQFLYDYIPDGTTVVIY